MKKTETASTKAIKKLTEKKESRVDKIKSLIPEGQSPALFIDLIKSQVLGTDREGKDRPDQDLMLFLYTAKRTGLDPLARQIYAVYRWDSKIGAEKMTIQAGIDGMRLVAQRSGHYAGQDDARFVPEDESTKLPVKATVTVYKTISGTRVPFTASARWGEYAQLNKNGELMGMWSKMPYLMLAKCAEALALRKAFPNELSGIYSEEEMQQSANLLADLPTPDKFSSKNISVDYGAPSDNRPKMKKPTEPAKAEKPSDNAKDVTDQNKTADIKPMDFGALRDKLKGINGKN